MHLVHFLMLILCYLAGSVPFGFLLTKRSAGLNILEHGSGNIGSTNVGRIAGKALAVKVQILDMGKGLLPVLLLMYSANREWMVFPAYFIYLAAFATVIGHNFSLFLRFRGGKGVNTTLGASLPLAPVEVICSVAMYFIVKSKYQYVSAGSMALAVSLPIAGVCLHRNHLQIAYLLLSCFMILFRHIPNIKRLLSGTENR